MSLSSREKNEYGIAMRYQDPLEKETTLALFQGEQQIWTSKGHWILPLFDLEQFLSTKDFDRSTLSLHDKIQGSAAAALVIRLGIKQVKSDLMSDGAIKLYQKYGITPLYGERTERIKCATEAMINESMDIQEIYKMLRKKAGL